jgi:PIN domain nuclease of toxin-antitoxin system
VIHLDTHVVVWLYLRVNRRFTKRASSLIGRSRDIRVSPMVLLELDDLAVMGRIKPPSVEAMISELDRELGGLSVSDSQMAEVIAEARQIGWTRDPFDRLIVANAIADGARLVTADERIREHFGDAVW